MTLCAGGYFVPTHQENTVILIAYPDIYIVTHGNAKLTFTKKIQYINGVPRSAEKCKIYLLNDANIMYKLESPNTTIIQKMELSNTFVIDYNTGQLKQIELPFKKDYTIHSISYKQ